MAAHQNETAAMLSIRLSMLPGLQIHWPSLRFAFTHTKLITTYALMLPRSTKTTHINGLIYLIRCNANTDQSNYHLDLSTSSILVLPDSSVLKRPPLPEEEDEEMKISFEGCPELIGWDQTPPYNPRYTRATLERTIEDGIMPTMSRLWQNILLSPILTFYSLFFTYTVLRCLFLFFLVLNIPILFFGFWVLF